MISPDQVLQTNRWLGQFRLLYEESIPIRIHSRDIALDGSPEWSDGMRRLMTDVERRGHDEAEEPAKLRLRRAMKRLRKRSLREYEVLYRIMVMRESVDQVTIWLNERAERGGYPERYSQLATSTIVYAATDKLCHWF